MIGFDPARDAAILTDAPASARYHRDAVEEMVQCVEEGVYCALLGPRLCGKTLLLRYIERNLAPLLGWTCVYIDLLELRAATQRVFFSDLIRYTAGRLSELTGASLPVPEEGEATSVMFRAFLSDCLEITGRDLVLLIDPLDALPTDLVQALLTSLRAAYMDQQTLDHQVIVVVSGALSLATLAVGESSPFRGIARRVFVGDLSENDSRALIMEFLMERGVSATSQAMRKLLAATCGDTYLIRRISQRSAEIARSRSSALLRSRDINYSTARFLRDEVFEYAPLVEAIRLIEEDPDLVECILQLLGRDSVPRAALPLPLSPDMDPLLLTGVVDRIAGDHYRLQNLIYRQFLSSHFTPGRVGYVLSLAGRWDSAIDYLAASIVQGNQQSRLDLLPATINSMYAAQDLFQAVHFLRRGLSAAFGVSEVQVWFSPPNERHLALIGPAEADMDGRLWPDRQIPLGADRLEARAFRQGAPLRGQEGERRVVRAIPLLIPGRRPIGVATIYDDLIGDGWAKQRERDLQLVGFLNQAARALQTVSLRRQELALAGRVQANLLPEQPHKIPGWGIASTWRPARETSGDFYDFVALPKGRVGLLIADVVDKGMGAALLMALSRTLIRTYAPEYPNRPARLLDVVNRRIIADIHSGLFLTLFYGILDPATGNLTYCNAGHPPPYILLPQAGAPGNAIQVEALHRTGMPVGISEETSWETASARVPPGALLLLYTDGISEAQNPGGELFGEAKILEAVGAVQDRPPREILDALVSSVYAFAGPQPQVDDITLVVLRHEV
jgi:serine phosphatase RsbU (regulator of sigma subunit)